MSRTKKALKILRKERDEARANAAQWYADALESAGDRRDLRAQLAEMKTSFDALLAEHDISLAQLAVALEGMAALGIQDDRTKADLEFELGVVQEQLRTAHEEIAKLRNQK